jgi:hypothetical protein
MIQVITNKIVIVPFPKLMISKNDAIVLFEKPCCGVLVKSGWYLGVVGYYSDNWDMNMFKDYYKAITLQNELP